MLPRKPALHSRPRAHVVETGTWSDGRKVARARKRSQGSMGVQEWWPGPQNVDKATKRTQGNKTYPRQQNVAKGQKSSQGGARNVVWPWKSSQGSVGGQERWAGPQKIVRARKNSQVRESRESTSAKRVSMRHVGRCCSVREAARWLQLIDLRRRKRLSGGDSGGAGRVHPMLQIHDSLWAWCITCSCSPPG